MRKGSRVEYLIDLTDQPMLLSFPRLRDPFQRGIVRPRRDAGDGDGEPRVVEREAGFVVELARGLSLTLRFVRRRVEIPCGRSPARSRGGRATGLARARKPVRKDLRSTRFHRTEGVLDAIQSIISGGGVRSQCECGRKVNPGVPCPRSPDAMWFDSLPERERVGFDVKVRGQLSDLCGCVFAV